MTDYQGTDDYTDYLFQSPDNTPVVSEVYEDISTEFKIQNLDTSYFDYERVAQEPACPRLKAVWELLCDKFNMYYATREIGGYSEYDFFCMMQSCLDRNADTFERQLSVYDNDIANPILGRTEKVTYDTVDDRNNTGYTNIAKATSVTRTEGGADTMHHIEVPVDADNTYQHDRTRDSTNYGRTVTDANSGVDTNNVNLEDKRTMTGTVTTELSDLGVRPNYESLNGFLDNNRTFIQEFINVFDECFAPRYRRVFF